MFVNSLSSVYYRSAQHVLADWREQTPRVQEATQDLAAALDAELITYRALCEGWCPGNHPLAWKHTRLVSDTSHQEWLRAVLDCAPEQVVASNLVATVLISGKQTYKGLAGSMGFLNSKVPIFKKAIPLALKSGLVTHSFKGLKPSVARSQATSRVAAYARAASDYITRVGVDEVGGISYFAEVSGIKSGSPEGLAYAIGNGSIIWAGGDIYSVPRERLSTVKTFDHELFNAAREHSKRCREMDQLLGNLLSSHIEENLQLRAKELGAALRRITAEAKDDGEEEEPWKLSPMAQLSKDDAAKVRNARGLYEILEVHTTSSYEEIRTAFRIKTRQNHPDSNGGIADHDLLGRIASAWEILGRVDLRAAYDSKET